MLSDPLLLPDPVSVVPGVGAAWDVDDELLPMVKPHADLVAASMFLPAVLIAGLSNLVLRTEKASVVVLADCTAVLAASYAVFSVFQSAAEADGAAAAAASTSATNPPISDLTWDTSVVGDSELRLVDAVLRVLASEQ